MHWTEIAAWGGFVFSFFVILPQIIKMIRIKDSSSVSIFMPLVYILHCIGMLPRVILLREWAYIISYGYGIGLNILMTYLIFKYRRKK